MKRDSRNLNILFHKLREVCGLKYNPYATRKRDRERVREKRGRGREKFMLPDDK